MSLYKKIEDLLVNVRLLHKRIARLEKQRYSATEGIIAAMKINHVKARRVKLTKPGLLRRPVQLTNLENKMIKTVNHEIMLLNARLRNWRAKQ